MFLSEVSSTKILANNVSFSTSFKSLNVYLTATIYIYIHIQKWRGEKSWFEINEWRWFWFTRRPIKKL